MVSGHALIFPYPAQSHVIALMELSYILLDHGFSITFINTQFNQNRVAAATKINGRDTEKINFVSIPDGLGPGEDRNNFARLTQGITTVMPIHLEELLRINNSASVSERFTCLVADINMAWSLNVANKMGLRTAAFWPAAAGVLSIILSIPNLIEDGIIDSEDGKVMKKEMAPANLPWNCFDDAHTRRAVFNYMISNNQAISNAQSIICNSFFELEKPVFDHATYVVPIGPIVRRESVCLFWPEDKTCIDWLDRQPRCSVVYVAFGSFAVFDKRQFEELAVGLELTGRPFLWVVRPDQTYGFEGRVADRGRMVGWSPQHEVLQHPAIACFLSHCGWNSILEGVRNGVPFLCWPFFADQFFNQSCVTDVWKTGLRMVAGEDGIVSKEEVSSKVDGLLKDVDIRARTLALKEMARRSVDEGGSSFENLSKFANSLKDV